MNKKTLLICACLAAIAPAANALDYTVATNIATGQRPDGLAIGDFDRDGDMDFAVSTDNPDRVQVFNNAGNATFSGPVNYALPNGSGPDAIVSVDLDNDNDLDLAVTLHNSGQVVILQNGGNGTFAAGQPFSVGVNPVHIVAANFGGSSLPDLATANRDGNSTSILTNTGALAFSRSDVASGIEPRSLAAGDYDADGDVDLVVTNHDDRTLALLRNNGGAFSVVSTINTGQRPEGIASGDLDNDGDIDLAVGTNLLAIYKNNGAGTFSGPFTFATGGADPDHVTIADLDTDGDKDVAVTDNTANIVSIFENLGGGNFAAATIVPVGTYAETVAAGDLDGDSDLDLLVANRDSNNVSFVKNNAVGAIPASSFTLLTGILLGGNTASIQASDDNRLVMRPGAVLTTQQAPIRLQLNATSPISTATNFKFELESVSSLTSIQQIVFLFNYQTNSFEQVDARQMTTSDNRTTIEIQTNASRFIESSTRSVRALVTWKASAPLLVFPWTVGVDEAKWRIR